MNRVTITLHIDLPDGVVPVVDYGQAPQGLVDPSTRPFREGEPELPPFPDAPPEYVQPAANIVPMCPEGHGPMKYVPGGTSKRTGKPYDAFYGCNNRDCKRTAKAA